MPQPRIFNLKNMSFNAVQENKIITKISEFTIFLDSSNIEASRNSRLIPVFGNDTGKITASNQV